MLADERCAPLNAYSVLASPGEVAALRGEVPEWRVADADGGTPKLERVFRFETFAQSLAFANAVGEEAESENHHPRLVIEWGRATVQWWTHALGGLHRNDFVMAARTDAVAGRAIKPSRFPLSRE